MPCSSGQSPRPLNFQLRVQLLVTIRLEYKSWSVYIVHCIGIFNLHYHNIGVACRRGSECRLYPSHFTRRQPVAALFIMT